MIVARGAAVVALLALGGCVYGGATGYAPDSYPAGYDSGMGSELMTQPGDRFGAQNVASIAVFTAPLAPYGQWVNSRFGRAFRPDVSQDWRPYVNGRWGENRLWVSEDPWGWATDHYGRWGFDQRAGWVWVPGVEWAPSWVAWREDEGQNVAGWAPVPPGVNYSISRGFGSGFGYDSFASWYAPSWVWVPQSYLYQPGFGGRVLPWAYGANYWGGSRWQYQPGFSGRPSIGFRPQFGGNWQGRPRYGQGNLQGGYAQQRPQGGDRQGRPRQDSDWQQDDNDQSRGQRNGGFARGDGGFVRGEGAGRRGVSRGDNSTAAAPSRTVEQPVMTYADRPTPQQRPQQQPRMERQDAPPRMEQAEAPQRIERQELQRQMEAQSMTRNDEGNTRPD